MVVVRHRDMEKTQKMQVNCRGRLAEVEVIGRGPDVVLVGTAAPMEWTRPAAEAVAALGFRVTNFDYGSGAEEPELRTALDQTPDVVDVMDAVGIESSVAVGISRGGMTAFSLAAHHPHRVSRLVLVAPVAGWPDVIESVDPTPESDPEEGPDAILRQVFSDGFLTSSRDRALSVLMTPPGSVDRVGREDEEVFPGHLKVDCPTLIVAGGRDQVVSAAHPQRYRSEIEGSVIHEVPEASHGWIMEDPDGFAALIEPFVRG